MSEVRINFLNWRPDAEDFGNQGLSIAQNVLHDIEGYKESRTMNTGTPLQTTSAGGQAHQIIGFEVPGMRGSLDQESSYSDNAGYLVAGAFVTTTVIRAGAAHQLGNGYIYTLLSGSNSATSIQSFDYAELNAAAVMTIRHREFAATSAPQATAGAIGYFVKSDVYGSTFTSLVVLDASSNTAIPAVCANVGQFIMAGNMFDVSPANAAVQWSALNDPTDWPIPLTDDARAKQSGREQLNPKFGEVMHIGGDDFFAYVFQQTGITKMTYVGGDVVFTVDTFEEVRGCYTFGHVARVDDMFFFESKYGRHVLENGVVTDILEDVNNTYPPDHTWGTRVEANPAIHTIFFTNGVAYNYQTQQPTYLPNITPIFSINDDNGIIGQWANGTGEFYLTNSDGGTAETATLTTGAVDINQGGRTVIEGVRPLINGGTTTVRVGAQDAISDAVSWSTATSLNSRTQYANLRQEGRYVRAEVTITGGFTTAIGADVEFVGQGKT